MKSRVSPVAKVGGRHFQSFAFETFVPSFGISAILAAEQAALSCDLAAPAFSYKSNSPQLFAILPLFAPSTTTRFH